jgi:hypothetical protein
MKSKILFVPLAVMALGLLGGPSFASVASPILDEATTTLAASSHHSSSSSEEFPVRPARGRHGRVHHGGYTRLSATKSGLVHKTKVAGRKIARHAKKAGHSLAKLGGKIKRKVTGR